MMISNSEGGLIVHVILIFFYALKVLPPKDSECIVHLTLFTEYIITTLFIESTNIINSRNVH